MFASVWVKDYTIDLDGKPYTVKGERWLGIVNRKDGQPTGKEPYLSSPTPSSTRWRASSRSDRRASPRPLPNHNRTPAPGPALLPAPGPGPSGPDPRPEQVLPGGVPRGGEVLAGRPQPQRRRKAGAGRILRLAAPQGPQPPPL